MENEGICLVNKFALICSFIVGLQIIRFLFNLIYENFLAPALQINAIHLKEQGKWAVVTGATDGIGKAYAEILAKEGLNVVLISRTQSKLEAVEKELTEKYNAVEFKTLVADFTDTQSIYHELDKQLNELDIGVLVNNVGMSYAHPEYFLDVTNKDQFFSNLINCNIFSVTNMCKIVMPGMVERRRGVVVNVSSAAAQIPNPLLSVYSASKAYVVKFSEDLGYEYSKFGITVQCLLPGYVATNMSMIRRATWMAPSALTYVKKAVKTIGIKEKTTGYFPHSLLVATIYILESISPKLSRWIVFRTLANVRARALRRAVQ